MYSVRSDTSVQTEYITHLAGVKPVAYILGCPVVDHWLLITDYLINYMVY